MVKLHNVCFRGLNSIHENALKVESCPADVQPFLQYCLLWWDYVHDHHAHEEQIAFPWMKAHHPEGCPEMDTNVDQHKIFEEGMVRFHDGIEAMRSGETPYSGDRVRKLLEAFSDDFYKHLCEEIETLSPAKMQVFDRDEFAAMVKTIDREVAKEMHLTTTSVWFMLHHDMSKGQQVHWPPIPAPAVWLTQNVFYFVHSSYWKFAPQTRKFTAQTYAPTA